MTNLKSSQETARLYKMYVGLCQPKSGFKPLAWLIRFSETPKSILKPSTWFLMYHSSHVFLAYPAHPKRDFYMVNEAVGSGVRWVSEPHFIDHTRIMRLYCFDLPEKVYRLVKNFGSRTSGAPYPFKENLGIAIQRLAKWIFNISIKNPFDQNSDAIKCSELFFRAVIEHYAGLDFQVLRTEIFNETGEEISSDVDDLGIRDTELVLEHLAEIGYCIKSEKIFPIKTLQD